MLMSSMIKTVIYPMVPSDVTQIRSIVVTMVNGFLELVENKVNKILLNTIDVCLSRMSYLLSKQRKRILLKDDSTEFIQTSIVSAEIIVFLTAIHKSAIASLRAQTLISYLKKSVLGSETCCLNTLRSSLSAEEVAAFLRKILKHIAKAFLAGP